jgi:hypothetical protein
VALSEKGKERVRRVDDWWDRRGATFAGVLGLAVIAFVAFFYVTELPDINRTVKRVETASIPCEKGDPASADCRRQARRLAVACFHDPRCRRLIVVSQGNLEDLIIAGPEAVTEGGGSSGGPSPPSPPGGGPPGQDPPPPPGPEPDRPDLSICIEQPLLPRCLDVDLP